MIYILMFLLVWGLITVLGHFSWVIIATVGKAMFGEETPPPDRPSLREDVEAMHRVLSLIASQRMMDAEEVRALRRRLDLLQERARKASLNRLVTSPKESAAKASPSSSVKPAPPIAPKTAQPIDFPVGKKTPQPSVKVPDDEQSDIPVAKPATSLPKLSPGLTATDQTPRPQLATKKVATSLTAVSKGSPEPEKPASPVMPEERISMGESLAAFLADHNIRWGELIAGALIVFCSIGLVISLWSTLTGLHRVVPSLIFLAGNTAIFGAGLYTLFRWRLPETSRATLVIAILLVPLSILAGLATGRIDQSAVLLNDPITLLSILGVGSVYVFLVWQSCRALVGSSNAPAATLGIAGPAAVLPFVPASIRTWGAEAGWIILVGSLAVWASQAWLVQRQKRPGKRKSAGAGELSRQIAKSLRGNVASHRAMVIGLSTFSFAVLVGYVAFMLRMFGAAWMTTALATIPGVIALSGAANSLSCAKTRPKLAYAGSVFASMLLFAVATLFVPSLSSQSWFFSWGISATVSAMLAAWVFSDARWTFIATVPIGIVLTMSSPSLLSEIPWSDWPIWRRLVGGEPMVVALSMAAGFFTVSSFVKEPQHRSSLRGGAWIWGSYGVALAAVLTVAPLEWMGAIHVAVLPISLAAATLFLVYDAWRTERDVSVESQMSWVMTALTCASTGAFWVSVFKPVVIGMPFPGLRPSAMVFAATAVCIVVFAEVLHRREMFSTKFRVIAAMLTSFAVPLALSLSVDHLITSMIILASSIALFGWCGLRNQDHLLIGLSRACTVIFALFVGHRFFPEWLTDKAAIVNGVAVWGWAGVAAIVAVLARLQDLVSEMWLRRMEQTQSNELLAHPLSPAAAWVAVAGTLSAAVLSFGSMVLVVATGQSIAIANNLVLPTIVLAAVILGSVLGKHVFRLNEDAAVLPHPFAAAAVMLWGGWQMGMRLADSSSSQLVIATSVAAVGCFLVEWFARGSHFVGRRSGVLAGVGLFVVTVSSAALMVGDWLPAITEGIRPDVFMTWAIATWWAAGALTSALIGYREKSKLHFALFAALVPAITVLLMPLALPGKWWMWGQGAALASLTLAVVGELLSPRLRTKGWITEDVDLAARPSLNVSLLVGIASGLSTCCLVILGVLSEQEFLLRLHQPLGLALSLVTTAVLLSGLFAEHSRGQLVTRLTHAWPLSISLLSGHLTLLLLTWLVADVTNHWLIAVVWLIAASLSLVEAVRLSVARSLLDRSNVWHASLAALAVMGLSILAGQETRQFVVGLLAAVLGVLLVTVRTVAETWGWREDRVGNRVSMINTRLFAIVSTVMGAIAIVRLNFGNIDLIEGITATLVWIGVLAVVWRVACPDRSGESERLRSVRLRLPDSELAVAVLLAVFVEAVAVWTVRLDMFDQFITADWMFWTRVLIGLLVAGSAVFRIGRSGAAEVGVVTVLVSVAPVTMRFSLEYTSGEPIAAVSVSLAAAISLSVSVMFASLVLFSKYFCSLASSVANTWHGLMPVGELTKEFSVSQWAKILVRISVLPVLVVVSLCGWMLVEFNDQSILPMAVCSVAILAVAIGELSEWTGQSGLRHAAVSLALVSIAMWTSVNVVGASLPLWVLSTRWFVGWIVVAVLLAVIVPKLLGVQTLERWRSAIRSGFLVSGSIAVAALSSTLILEGMIRVSARTGMLHEGLVLGTAAVLALISLIATFAAIASGPGFSYQQAWKLSDRQRSGLAVTAQMFGGLTWFHLFLCKSPLADLGLRAYWPYVVMALAFASTGITQWAQRRGDKVLEQTLKQTALYLPLIPVIGFWLSGSWVTSLFGQSNSDGWTYISGQVSYQALLLAAAVYYAVVSFLWKSGQSRVFSIVLGNLALWVVLMQTPGWSFLAHPQAWLIPPAVCALVMTHFHRDQLGKTAATNLRYAATLVIYITSTADMLIQGVGETLLGPIVLITLAMIGMGLGVALKIRPFLYLGATFVMVGLISMVAHAQQQIGSVWPWWVFGITTGIALLAGLMGVEKNKPRLREIAQSMRQWDT